MSILSGLMNKFKKEVVDKVAEAVKNGIDENKPASPAQEEFPTGTVIPGGVPNGFVIGGGSAPAPAAHESSWYDAVPAEECQYNFNGTYLDYFSKVFREEFPGYETSLETIDPSRRYKYTFSRGGAAVLVVELMTERSEANSLRRECLKNGMPYVRFYFDHEGWWNTRGYVKERVAQKLP